MAYSRDTTAISEITGEPVNTWSEEWRAECEARTVLEMSPTARVAFFNGVKGTDQRGIIAIRGAEGAAAVRDLMEKLQAARQRKR